MVLSIIGTAGRGEDYVKLSKEKWNNVKIIVLSFIKEKDIFTSLISGGAAFADHLAVGLHNKGLMTELELALPCEFDMDKSQFKSDGFKSPGSTANYYHQRFSKMMGRDSLKELKTALETCKISYGNGFLDRNKIVAAKANYLLAITFGNENQVKDGGTSHTTSLFIKKNSNQNAFHLDLNKMEIYPNAITVK